MTAIAQRLDVRLHEWPLAVREKVEKLVSEIIEFGDEDALNFLRSREVEQEVLELIDEPPAR